MIGGPVINQNMQAAAVKGRIIDVGRMGGLKGEIDLDLHSLKRISFIGVTFRTRSIDEIQTIIRLMVADIWPDVTAGKVKLPIASAFPLEKIRDAYAYMRANTHVGSSQQATLKCILGQFHRPTFTEDSASGQSAAMRARVSINPAETASGQPIPGFTPWQRPLATTASVGCNAGTPLPTDQSSCGAGGSGVRP